MRWEGQQLAAEADGALPGLARLSNLVRTVRTPEFAGVTFYEVLARSALNRVPGNGVGGSGIGWTINPYRGCSHACVYCFARPTHRYLDFDDPGAFDRDVIVKVNIGEVLRQELAKPSRLPATVALGTNTDPYQRAEGRYRLMPEIVSALADAGCPISVLTKGTLLRRDLPLYAELAERVPVQLAMSIAIVDDELQAAVEPGTPTAAARLATVAAARAAGLDCGVLMMPVLPYLTDSIAHLDEALRRIAEAGATSVHWGALYLKSGVREWFLAWLRQHHPDLEQRYLDLYAGTAYAPKPYRDWLARRVRPIVARYGLTVGFPDQGTGVLRVNAAPPAAASASRPPSGPHSGYTAPQPALF